MRLMAGKIGLFLALLLLAENAFANDAFKFYEALLYKNKPNLSEYGLEPLTLIYHSPFWQLGDARENVPSVQTMRNVFDDTYPGGAFVVIDIEHWPLKPQSESYVSNRQKYTTFISRIRAVRPDLQLGMYAMVPKRNYWAPIKGKNSKAYRSWQQTNDELAIIGRQLDVTMPSLYTFYADRDGWRTYALAQISESRRLFPGKPVIVFLWPQYHESSRGSRLEYLSRDYWRLQLETVYEHADGVVIWGGWDVDAKRKSNWRGDWAWWDETVKFVFDKKGEILSDNNTP